MTSRSYTVAELQAMLREAEARDKAAADALRSSVTPRYAYSVAKVTTGFKSDKMWDESVVLYRLYGECVNRDECEAVGQKTHEGGMNYMFNSLSGKIVTATGGGSIFISNPWNRPVDHDYEAEAIAELSAFLVTHPDGGDVTSIIEAHQAAKGGH